MPQINESPTLTAVVAEALNRAQRIASECAKDLITLASNLAITKIDLKMQATQSQKYDNVFVNLGAKEFIIYLLLLWGYFTLGSLTVDLKMKVLAL